MNGLISDIQHCSVHDGPGIRTTVFLKGCNLRCAWCHNPETVYNGKEILTNPELCIGCGRCSEGCFSGAKVECGKSMSVDEVMADILLDAPYYGSEGGVTVSGGEPILQAEFTENLLLACKSKGLNRAIETNLSLDTQLTLKICGLCDLIMCDLKLWDSQQHKKFTGIKNDRIKENLQQISRLGIPIILRTPVMSGVNDSTDEINSIAEFLSALPNIQYYELLTYHPLGLSKGKSQHFTPQIFKAPAKNLMASLGEIILSKGLPARIDNIVVKGK